jgi:surface carbohydrate biosynthesis protein
MEIFNREYWGKVALAAQLVELNHCVTIGYNHRVRHFASLGQPGDVFFETKGRLPQSMEHLEVLRNKGLKLVGQDEEAGISFSKFSDFSRHRPEVKGVGYFDAFFSWGELDQKEFLDYSQKEKIHRTGSPRTLFWGEFGARFFDSDIQQMKDKYGDYVLIISNTTSHNSIVSKRQLLGIMNEMDYDKSYSEVLESRDSWEQQAYKQTVNSVNEILNNSDLNIVIRPHPVEDIGVWQRLFAGSNRVFVDKDGSGTPAVHGATATVHAGSTLGLESAVAGKRTISLQKLILSEEVEMTANEFSTCITKITDLVPAIYSENANVLNKDRLKQVITRWSDAEVLVEQSSVISQANRSNSISYPSHFNSEVAGIQIKRIWRRIRYGKSPAEQMHKHKRPEINLNVFESDLNRFQSIMGFVRSCNVSQLSESTFEVTPRK